MATRHSITAAATPDGSPAIKPDERTAEPKSKPPAKRTRAAQPKSRAKASSGKTPKEASQGRLSGLVEKAATDAQGTVQVAVRVSPRTKQRLRETMIRAGLVQEKFIALMIEQGLDELDEVLAAREAAEK